MASRTKVLFLCVGNACRSQMAEAIAKDIADDVIEPTSAGLIAFGQIPESTLAVLREHGISAEGQTSKALCTEDLSEVDLVINMSGRSGKTIFTASPPAFEDWDVGDPFGSDLAIYRAIRDQIEKRVEDLARRLRETVHSASTSYPPRKGELCRAKKPVSRAKIT